MPISKQKISYYLFTLISLIIGISMLIFRDFFGMLSYYAHVGLIFAIPLWMTINILITQNKDDLRKFFSFKKKSWFLSNEHKLTILNFVFSLFIMVSYWVLFFAGFQLTGKIIFYSPEFAIAMCILTLWMLYQLSLVIKKVNKIKLFLVIVNVINLSLFLLFLITFITWLSLYLTIGKTNPDFYDAEYNYFSICINIFTLSGILFVFSKLLLFTYLKMNNNSIKASIFPILHFKNINIATEKNEKLNLALWIINSLFITLISSLVLFLFFYAQTPIIVLFILIVFSFITKALSISYQNEINSFQKMKSFQIK